MGEARILITDDEALFRTSAADSLRARFRGVEVLEAADGAAALDIMSRMPVNVLITDLQMPNLGGIELVARVSSHRMPVQVIVVSAHMTDQTRGALDDLGALTYIDKPIDLDVLHSAVERMLAVPRAHVGGVTLAGFVQLLEMEQRTCALRVSSADGVGMLVFQAGRLVDAWTGELSGDAAALAILGFRECSLDLIGVLSVDKQRVRMPLSFLLLESARRSDESEPPPVAGQWEIVSVDELAPAHPTSPTLPSPAPTASCRPGPSDMEVKELLRSIMEIDGAVASALADAETGELIGVAGEVPRDQVAATLWGDIQMLVTKQRLMKNLNLSVKIEDILVTLEGELHLIRPLERDGRALLLYLSIDRRFGNMALARRTFGRAEAMWLGDPVSSGNMPFVTI